MARKPPVTYFGSVCLEHPELNGLRLKSTRSCLTCARLKAAAYYQKNLEAIREKHRKYAREHQKENSARVLEWIQEHKEKHREKAAQWRKINPEKARSFTRNWVSKNLSHCAERESRRRVVTKQAIPAWANEFFMKEAYALARLRTKMFGCPWHVDHIVPLQSHIVCGLHCEQNFAVIPGKSNSSKGNRHWPDMPDTLRKE